MLIFGRENLAQHWRWILFTLAALAAMIVLYLSASIGTSDWPGGSSLVGFWLGMVGGLIILFECLLWVRKKYLRAWRIGRTQSWLRTHIWLGLLTVPLLILHSGFRLGGPLSTVLMVLLVIVVLSGIGGFWLQNVLPRRMLEEVPAETVYSQIDHLGVLLAVEAERLVAATCGTVTGEKTFPPEQNEAVEKTGAHLTIGAVRTAGRVQGKVVQTRVPAMQVSDAEPLRLFFRDSVKPFLDGSGGAASPLRSPTRSGVMFRDLRTKLPSAAHVSVDALEGLCEQRRQLIQQARLHFWLHSWLSVHLPLSAALLVLMIVHAVVALKYW